jgi:hypothetical protein
MTLLVKICGLHTPEALALSRWAGMTDSEGWHWGLDIVIY